MEGKQEAPKQDIRKALVAKQKFSMVATPFSAKQYEMIYSATPTKQVYTRPGKGGKTFRYVKGNYVKKRLNYIFGSLWSFEILGEMVQGNQVIIKGKLTIQDKTGSPIIVKMQYGRADIKYLKGTKDAVDLGNDFKAASTDCLKKCASEVGICSDIYSDEEDGEVKKEKFSPKLNPTGTDYVSKLADLIDNDPKLREAYEGVDIFQYSQQEAQREIAKLLNR